MTALTPSFFGASPVGHPADLVAEGSALCWAALRHEDGAQERWFAWCVHHGAEMLELLGGLTEDVRDYEGRPRALADSESRWCERCKRYRRTFDDVCVECGRPT